MIKTLFIIKRKNVVKMRVSIVKGNAKSDCTESNNIPENDSGIKQK